MSQIHATETAKREVIEISLEEKTASGAERRQHERIPIPEGAKITVWDACGTPIGSVCQLSEGGMRIRVFPGEDWLRAGEDYVFIMRNATQEMCFSAWVVVKNFNGREAGCQFQNIDPQVAGQVGDIIGVYKHDTEKKELVRVV
jgi:c-di-GMP-binding flagellar brake protein YcgR